MAADSRPDVSGFNATFQQFCFALLAVIFSPFLIVVVCESMPLYAEASRATSRAAVTGRASISAVAAVKSSMSSVKVVDGSYIKLSFNTLKGKTFYTFLAQAVANTNGKAEVPSKHRLISVRSSSLVLSGSSVPGAGASGVPDHAQPLGDGDLYIINAVNAKGALSLSYSRDCKLLAVGETSGSIRVFRTGLPDELCCLSLQLAVEGRGHTKTTPVTLWGGKAVAVTCLRPWPSVRAESTDPTMLAGYADGKIRLWNVKQGTVIREITEGRQCLGLAVSPNLSHFVSLGDDGGVYLYDAETGVLLTKLMHSGFSDVVDGHISRTFSAVFHPLDMNGLVTGGWDNLLQFWDIRLGQSVRHTGETHIGGSESLDISPDGQQVLGGDRGRWIGPPLLSCSWRNVAQIQLWDYGTAKLIEDIQPDKTQSYLYAGRFLSENLLCCGGSSSNLFRLVHIGQKVTVGTVTGLAHGIYSIALGPVGARYHPNPSLNSGKSLLPHNRDKCPRVAFCSDSKIVEMELY